MVALSDGTRPPSVPEVFSLHGEQHLCLMQGELERLSVLYELQLGVYESAE
jgi:hypothetical protein